ncbi:sigma-70 family RNA polymerase sigma factor [Pseudorhodoferax soli]|jgi:RNA polymerase sigma-70 factor (ECF subfamily)|uniref:RNA polymerase ECF family sigma subunit n=1 Tax=Pseudorhodoferax soli TaxID=545864 RepID=A0A368Y929_9BURK|nr:sigma-70 family RNA polymerase sigma factor [Pseudorhodoferax soli]RCW76702.1 RNA polymerase ECF family sigma subunit [Pseudorhodoferax soli]
MLQRSHHDMPDEALMQAYAAGDSAAFDLLYARHEAALLRFVRRLLGTRLAAQADEVFQDTWMRIIGARASFDAGRAGWRTWAFTIAHNLAMDRLRTSGREQSLDQAAPEGDDPLDWLQEALDLAHPPADDLAHWRAAGRQLLHCLDALPDAQRAAFLLHHEDGASVEDLAARLGLGFETAKSRLRYALAKLRGCMQHYLTPNGAAR